MGIGRGKNSPWGQDGDGDNFFEKMWMEMGKWSWGWGW